MPKDFTTCVKKVQASGKDESAAYAICTYAFKKAGKPTKLKGEKMEKEKVKKYDSEGREIVAENVKFFIEGTIDTIKE